MNKQIIVLLTFFLFSTNLNSQPYTRVTRVQLLELIEEGANVSNLDVSGIFDMSYLFRDFPDFNQDISNWDVSNVTNMSGMFFKAKSFNQDISSWDVSKVTDMSSMFSLAETFNQDISSWDVGNVKNMSGMFYQAKSFNQDIGTWDVSLVTHMYRMFCEANSFNQDISSWDVSNVTSMSRMFYGAEAFNQDIGIWDVSNVNNMSGMFYNAYVFNHDIGSWEVSNVKNMSEMFYGAEAFNQDIGSWNVYNVTNMSGMFRGASTFNQDIGLWETGNVTDMSEMFFNSAAFDQDISSWNIENVTNIFSMFRGARSFNSEIKWSFYHPNGEIITNNSWRAGHLYFDFDNIYEDQVFIVARNIGCGVNYDYEVTDDTFSFVNEKGVVFNFDLKENPRDWISLRDGNFYSKYILENSAGQRFYSSYIEDNNPTEVIDGISITWTAGFCEPNTQVYARLGPSTSFPRYMFGDRNPTSFIYDLHHKSYSTIAMSSETETINGVTDYWYLITHRSFGHADSNNVYSLEDNLLLFSPEGQHSNYSRASTEEISFWVFGAYLDFED